MTSTFVLVHGAWHGAWCWDKVAPLLEAAGYKVETPDLPGHGEDKTPVSEVSLQAYTDRICDLLDKQPEPVILVGHSMGGMVISQAAEQRPDKIETLVYLTAWLLHNGVSQMQRSQADTENIIGQNRIVQKDKGVATLPDEVWKPALYDDCSEEDIARAKSLVIPQPLAPIRTPIVVTEENFGRVPRVYIECLRDRGIAPEIQREMYTELPCREIISMETSHSPFFSAPETLANHLLSLAVGRRNPAKQKGL